MTNREIIKRQLRDIMTAMYNLEKLQAIDDRPADLERYYLDRLKAMREEIGDKLYDAVHGEYPRFREAMKAHDLAMQEFDDHCGQCIHWTGLRCDDSGWCDLYRREEVTAPRPCPAYRLKVLN